MSMEAALPVRTRVRPPVSIMEPAEITTLPEVRTRVRPAPAPAPGAPQAAPAEGGGPALPSYWVNGSGVFLAGTAGRKSSWSVSAENSGGLLGRVQRVDDTFHVWRWSNVKKSYRYIGVAENHVAGINLLSA